MRSKPFIWIAVSMLMVLGTIYAASALDYFTYRMNFEPGSPEYHVQEMTFTGNLTITLPSGFSFISSTASYNQSGINFTWENSSQTTINYTIQSPGSCTEGDVYKSALYEDFALVDEFVYVCIDDMKITDYKVEYGHGCGNYLASDEPYISNESAAVFNLLRVWNIGNYLDPDEDAENAQIDCWYGDYPVSTYGRAEVGYESNGVNASFLWDIIYGGYWFRIGVISQIVSGKSIGDLYSVNCTELTYDFSHERVVASFPNYTLEVRSPLPFTRNSTVYGIKELITITNSEEYPVYSVVVNYIYDDSLQTEHISIMDPGDFIRLVADTGTNVTLNFIPSWQRHCFSSIYYEQTLTNSTLLNRAPVSVNIPSQAWAENTSNDNAFDLDNYFSDPDNDSLTYGYIGAPNITVAIGAGNVVSFSQPENFTGIEYVRFWASDGNTTTYSNNITLVVYSTNGTTTINQTVNVTNVTIIRSGGGGKTRYEYIYIPVNITRNVSVPYCLELWHCEEWSECLPEGIRSRACDEINECGTTFFRPSTESKCEYAEPFEEAPGEFEPVCKTCVIIPAVLIVLFIVLVILILTENDNEKHKKTKKYEVLLNKSSGPHKK